ncbi:MAG: hypothetical protein HRT72_07885, partial [Flavobacteriales bacterium]|nr:hypothetical protein [Flavobacteriales bacterium]
MESFLIGGCEKKIVVKKYIYSKKYRLVFVFKLIVYLLISMLFSYELSAQETKVVVINNEQNLQEIYPEVPSYSNQFSSLAKSVGSCWNDLDGTYSNITNSVYGVSGWAQANPGDDGSYGPIDLGFTYTFYGVEYTSVYINVNGNVTFGNLYSAYSASGFPSSSVPAMIAPYWGDVDLRGTGLGANQIYYKLDSNKITIQWVGTGHYNKKTALTNTFQLVMTDGTDPVLGAGYNTRFAYDDMNWCVGDASGGTNGFGSNVYGTVGAQTE